MTKIKDLATMHANSLLSLRPDDDERYDLVVCMIEWIEGLSDIAEVLQTAPVRTCLDREFGAWYLTVKESLEVCAKAYLRVWADPSGDHPAIVRDRYRRVIATMDGLYYGGWNGPMEESDTNLAWVVAHLFLAITWSGALCLGDVSVTGLSTKGAST